MDYQTFVDRAVAAHANKYEYPAWAQNLTSSQKIPIICKIHGGFTQTINDHIHGKSPKGCRKCGLDRALRATRDTLPKFIKKARGVHGNFYSYPAQPYVRSASKIRITCPIHGEFLQIPNAHLNGCGCPTCADQKRIVKKRKPLSEFLRRARAKHGGRFSYPIPVNFEGMRSKIRIVCPDHGEFTQQADVHIRGEFSCPKCGEAHIGRISRVTHEDVVARLEEMHFDQPWEFLERGENNNLVFYCHRKWASGVEHGEFSMLVSNFSAGKGCKACAKTRSRAEDEIKDFVRGLGFPTMVGKNSTVSGLGRYELDIVVPAKKIAIEYNGVLWHSELFKANFKRAHLEKTMLAESLGYRLIHIFEDEWLEKKEIVKNRIRAILGGGLQTIAARKTKVVALSWRVAAEFLTTHHLQGAGVAPRHSFGLVHDGLVVAVATFGAARYSKEDSWELLRFVSSARVVGGASKLLAAFKRTVNPTGSLISYADRRWSQGDVYKAVGFSFAGNTPPNYFYTKGVKRFSREKFQKHRLGAVLAKFDEKASEVKNCHNNGFYRIFDCGNSRWRLDLNGP